MHRNLMIPSDRAPLPSLLVRSTSELSRCHAIARCRWVIAGAIALNLVGDVAATPNEPCSTLVLHTDSNPQQSATGNAGLDDQQLQNYLQSRGLTRFQYEAQQLVSLLEGEKLVEAQSAGKRLLREATVAKNASELRMLTYALVVRRLDFGGESKVKGNLRMIEIGRSADELADKLDTLPRLPSVFAAMARDAADSAVKIDPSDPESMLTLALVEYRSGCLEVSLELLDRAQQLDESMPVGKAGRWRAALAALRREFAKRLSPKA